MKNKNLSVLFIAAVVTAVGLADTESSISVESTKQDATPSVSSENSSLQETVKTEKPKKDEGYDYEIAFSASSGTIHHVEPNTSMALRLGYHRWAIDRWFQIGMKAGFSAQFIDQTSTYAMEVLPVVALNIPLSRKESSAIFIGTGFGLNSVFGDRSSAGWIWQNTVGVRAQIFNNLTYRPAITLTQLQGSSSSIFEFNLVSFSAVF